MRKKVPVVTVARADEAAELEGLPEKLTLALAEVAGAIREGLLAFASATGLAVLYQMMDAELSSAYRCQARQARRSRAPATGTARRRDRSSSEGGS